MLNTKFYSDYVEDCLNEEPIKFLDNTELNYLVHLSEKVLIDFIRDVPQTNHTAAFAVSGYLKYFKNKKALSKELIQDFNLWLTILKSDAVFSEEERNVLKKMILQCERFAQSVSLVLPDEQEGTSDEQLVQQINTLKSFKEYIEKNDPTIRQKLVETEYGEPLGRFYDAMRMAYSEGKDLLKIPENVKALKDLMTATRIDKNHDEFVITGEHHGNVHKNSDLQRGFTKSNGTKSSRPVYYKEENTLFQSHPSISPLSMNPDSDFYHQEKVRKGGDLGHILKANKKMFVINRDGDIFFSNPDLAGICLNELAGCTNLGQVYLGNIEDFLK